MLTIIEQVLNKDEVQQFRLQLDRSDWHDGQRTAGAMAQQVKHNLQLDDHAETAQNLGRHILRCLSQHPVFISAALPQKIYPPKFNRYEAGASYGLHVDSGVMTNPGTGQYLRCDLAATLFLSEAHEYDGGELEIETGFGAQTVKLDAGDMVLYPASSLHRVTPVTKGARIGAFFWIESMVGDVTERAMLFDLDQAIQALTPVLAPQNEALLKISGTYHNLLRRWAIT